DVMSNAVEGENESEDNEVDNVLAMGALYPETIQIVTTEHSGTESVDAMQGTATSVGARAAGTSVSAPPIGAVHGWTLEDIDAQNLDFDESTGGIQDGNIDAAFITAGTPAGSVEGLGATEDISIVPIEEDVVEELVDKYPYYAADTVEEGMYDLDEDV